MGLEQKYEYTGHDSLLEIRADGSFEVGYYAISPKRWAVFPARTSSIGSVYSFVSCAIWHFDEHIHPFFVRAHGALIVL